MLSPTDLILVAVINNTRDFEIARMLGWYRIPIRSAPKVIAVDYLAFYQTSAFGQDKWCIQWVAAVKGHELASRRELLRDEPDHPHADHEYYKIQLGALEKLPRAIPAGKWRRITFLYTTGDYLMNSETVSDLVVRSEERSTLWQALRERASQSTEYGDGSEQLPGSDLDPALLAMVLGLSQFTKEGSQSW